MLNVFLMKEQLTGTRLKLVMRLHKKLHFVVLGAIRIFRINKYQHQFSTYT